MIRDKIETERYTLYLGDCLEVLPTIAPGSVDAIVTDPPYSSGGQFRGDRTQKTSVKYVNSAPIDTCRDEFTGDNRDQRAFLAWSTMVFSECFHASVSGAVICTFTDWRQLPTMSDAIQCGGWVWRNIVTWWKPGCRMQRGRFSASAEYVVYGSKGVPKEGEKSPQNVLQFSGVSGCDKNHIAEKPIEVISEILGVTELRAAILDPFMGSGTTGVAAMKLGRRFIGVEIDEKYFAIAHKRIAEAAEEPPLFKAAREAEQATLFEAAQ